jgi:hypothetical protein
VAAMVYDISATKGLLSIATVLAARGLTPRTAGPAVAEPLL